MTRTKGGPATDQGGASTPTQDGRDREPAGIAGNVPATGGKPSPAGGERGETSAADDQPPIDLDTARDRAS